MVTLWKDLYRLWWNEAGAHCKALMRIYRRQENTDHRTQSSERLEVEERANMSLRELQNAEKHLE